MDGQVKRLYAFTIVELCIVMLLSTIVVGMVFFTLNIFQGSILRYKKESVSIAGISLLHRLLLQDIWQSSKLYAASEGIVAEGKAGKAIYEFSSNFILREKNGQADTFYFPSSPVEKKFRNQVIEVSGLLVDEVNFQLEYKGETFPFSFQKTYGADILMQQAALNE